MSFDVEKHEDDAPAGPGAWIVSFNDCMTNMLCFFVLLVSFSSFDVSARARITGTFQMMSNPSVLPQRMEIRESDVQPIEQVLDRTERGAERITDAIDPTRSPLARPFVPDQEAYRDRHVIYLDAGELFVARGVGLSIRGQQKLRSIVEFMKLQPCDVVIREVPSGPASSYSPVERALAVVDYMTRQGVDARRFVLASAGPDLPADQHGKSVVELTLLGREVGT